MSHHVRAPSPASWRRPAVALAALLAVVLAAAPAGGAPVTGLFKSDDLDGGVFLTGRWTEGFVGGDPAGVGNGAHAGSWDGAALYTQWELRGPTLTGSTEFDTRVGGNGTVIYDRTFETSDAWLILKSLPWWTGAGDGDYTVDLDAYAQTVTVLYSGGAPVSARSVESFSGTFVGYPGHVLVGQADGAYVGQGAAPPPAAYPGWIPGTVTGGAWGDAGLIRIEVTPEPATLGLMGIGLAAVALGRRR